MLVRRARYVVLGTGEEKSVEDVPRQGTVRVGGSHDEVRGQLDLGQELVVDQ
jgi:hypothetical protein